MGILNTIDMDTDKALSDYQYEMMRKFLWCTSPSMFYDQAFCDDIPKHNRKWDYVPITSEKSSITKYSYYNVVFNDYKNVWEIEPLAPDLNIILRLHEPIFPDGEIKDIFNYIKEEHKLSPYVKFKPGTKLYVIYNDHSSNYRLNDSSDFKLFLNHYKSDTIILK
jgi:hypothetical protein